jgi:hypothetical protein
MTVFYSVKPAHAIRRENVVNRWNRRLGDASNPRFRPMPPKPPGREVGPQSVWGRFGSRWIVEWPCTSTASLPRQSS